MKDLITPFLADVVVHEECLSLCEENGVGTVGGFPIHKVDEDVKEG